MSSLLCVRWVWKVRARKRPRELFAPHSSAAAVCRTLGTGLLPAGSPRHGEGALSARRHRCGVTAFPGATEPEGARRSKRPRLWGSGRTLGAASRVGSEGSAGQRLGQRLTGRTAAWVCARSQWLRTVAAVCEADRETRLVKGAGVCAWFPVSTLGTSGHERATPTLLWTQSARGPQLFVPDSVCEVLRGALRDGCLRDRAGRQPFRLYFILFKTFF